MFQRFPSLFIVNILFLTFSISSGQVRKDDELVNEELIRVGENDSVSLDLNCTDGCEGSGILLSNNTVDDDEETSKHSTNDQGNPSLDIGPTELSNENINDNKYVVPNLPDYIGGEFASDCDESEFGCCQNTSDNTKSMYPAHGLNQLGCCASEEYQCCLDDRTPAEGPYSEGCPDCKSSEFGCCPDNLTPAKGANESECGCRYSEHGCCPDSITQAVGPSFEGCGCETFEFGCCPDGETVAKGPNLEGCKPCNSDFGCCPDNITPKLEDCGCEGSIYGCCLDGNNTASGPNFQGCNDEDIPGQMCHLKPDPGSCRDFVPKWFYDTEYGGCNRYWYGGCGGGENRFDEEESCFNTCVEPRGSNVCFLKMNKGSCEGKYNEWYFDYQRGTCKPFVYGGCLGNGNRFLTKQECEDMCIEKQPSVELCMKPKAEGGCAGDYTRWYYDHSLGHCMSFSYSGCSGNNNQFLTETECQNACLHKSKEALTDKICKMFIDPGNCNDDDTSENKHNQTLAKWAYDQRLRRCIPFFYTGCKGNQNKFDTKSECESYCPTSYPPVINFPNGDEVLLKKGSEKVILFVSIRANPPDTTVKWYHNGRRIHVGYAQHYDMLSDYSLMIDKVSKHDGGKYDVVASNGIGDGPSSKSIKVMIYPLKSKVKIEMEKAIFAPDETIEIPCTVVGYPPPDITWYKVKRRQGKVIQNKLVTDGTHIRVDSFQVSRTVKRSNLFLYDVLSGDSGHYKCEATSDSSPTRAALQSIKVRFGMGSRCVDDPTYTHCDKIVQYKFCGNKYYGQYCCKSCTDAGMIPGGV